MYPKKSYTSRQRGFLIPLALILLVGIAFLAIAISRLSSQSGTQATVEGLSAQAFYAAESGAQYGMANLFENVTARAQTDTNCALMAGGVTITYTIPGLAICTAVVSCRSDTDTGNTISFYYINSLGECGGGQLLGQREIEVSAYMK